MRGPGAVVVWEVKSCDRCGKSYPVSHLSAVIVEDRTSELLCSGCIDLLRIDILEALDA